MITPINKKIRVNNESKNTLINSIKILSDVTRRDIEKSYYIENTHDTKAYYSNRNGWTLRRITD